MASLEKLKHALQHCVAGDQCQFLTYGEFGKQFKFGHPRPWATRTVLDAVAAALKQDPQIGLDLTFLLRNGRTKHQVSQRDGWQVFEAPDTATEGASQSGGPADNRQVLPWDQESILDAIASAERRPEARASLPDRAAIAGWAMGQRAGTRAAASPPQALCSVADISNK